MNIFLEISRDITYETVMGATLMINRIFSFAKVVIFNGITKQYLDIVLRNINDLNVSSINDVCLVGIS